MDVVTDAEPALITHCASEGSVSRRTWRRPLMRRYWRQIMLAGHPIHRGRELDRARRLITVPVHWKEMGVPIGIQFMGRIG